MLHCYFLNLCFVFSFFFFLSFFLTYNFDTDYFPCIFYSFSIFLIIIYIFYLFVFLFLLLWRHGVAGSGRRKGVCGGEEVEVQVGSERSVDSGGGGALH